MMTARPDGSEVAIVAWHGGVSHFDWRDPDHILAWGLIGALATAISCSGTALITKSRCSVKVF